MPRDKRDGIERMDELHGFLRQSMISGKNVDRLKKLTGHSDSQVAELAALILEIARVLPGKRHRWLKLARRHRLLFDKAVQFLGLEFFEDLLAGYGDFESPLWDILEEYQIAPPWTGRACDCGSGRPFRDCCMELENDRADEEASNDLTEAEGFDGVELL